jgi:beta-carotene hydroxylase
VRDIPLPSIRKLGTGLTTTTPLRLIVTLAAPFVAAVAYFAFAFLDLWPRAIVAVMVLTFVSYGSSSHDLVHCNLGLPRAENDALLQLMEMVCLRSGTAYQLSHRHHHRRFGQADDVEASASSRGLLYALLQGPTHQFRLWFWAWRLHPKQRQRLAVEAVWFWLVCTAGVGLAVWGWPQLLGFVVLVIAGSWLFPLITVHIPHDPKGEFPLAQTRVFRGVFYDVLAFGHLYHLEHHLYPTVPHQHWRKLARRLDPYFKQAGIKPYRVF